MFRGKPPGPSSKAKQSETKMGQTSCPKRRQVATNVRYVTSQKSVQTVYTAAKDWNHETLFSYEICFKIIRTLCAVQFLILFSMWGFSLRYCMVIHCIFTHTDCSIKTYMCKNKYCHVAMKSARLHTKLVFRCCVGKQCT